MATQRLAKGDMETPERIESAMLETFPPSITDVVAELSAESAVYARGRGDRFSPALPRDLKTVLAMRETAYAMARRFAFSEPSCFCERQSVRVK